MADNSNPPPLPVEFWRLRSLWRQWRKAKKEMDDVWRLLEPYMEVMSSERWTAFCEEMLTEEEQEQQRAERRGKVARLQFKRRSTYA